MNDCTICNELNNVIKNNRLFNYNYVRSAKLIKNEHFSIIPSIGALTLGHSLIVTNKHTNSVFKYVMDNHLERGGAIQKDTMTGDFILKSYA